MTRFRRTRTERLAEALEACRLVRTFVAGVALDAFLIDPMRLSAVKMELFQIGEILKPLDDADPDFRDELPEIGRIIGLRNMIAHQ